MNATVIEQHVAGIDRNHAILRRNLLAHPIKQRPFGFAEAKLARVQEGNDVDATLTGFGAGGMPVSTLRAVTFAPTTTVPELSVTVPVPVILDCARAETTPNVEHKTMDSPSFILTSQAAGHNTRHRMHFWTSVGAIIQETSSNRSCERLARTI